MLLEQGATLTLGHSTPDPELHPVVQRVGAALHDDRTVPTDHRSLTLRSTAHEQLIGIGGPADGLRHPGDSGFPVRSLVRY